MSVIREEVMAECIEQQIEELNQDHGTQGRNSEAVQTAEDLQTVQMSPPYYLNIVLRPSDAFNAHLK